MPPLVRRYVKTSFAFLIAGLLLGAWIVVAEFLLGRWPPRIVVTAHVHLVLVGFVLLLVMGIATWMFPRPARDDVRYRPAVADVVYWLMTLATATRAAAELALALALPVRIVVAAAGLAQLGGAILFVVNMWSRIRMPSTAGTHTG